MWLGSLCHLLSRQAPSTGGAGHAPRGQSPWQAVLPQQSAPLHPPLGMQMTLSGQSPEHWKPWPSGPACGKARGMLREGTRSTTLHCCCRGQAGASF